MAHMECTCGNYLSNVCFPNLMEGKICGCFEYDEKTVWECRICGRLWIDIKDDNGLTHTKSYIPEDNEAGKLFNVANNKEFIKYLKKIKNIHGKEILLLYADPNYFD